MKCRTCRTPIESMRTTDKGVVFLCERCGCDLAAHDVVRESAEPHRAEPGKQPSLAYT